jgi:hypothetical protein
MAASAALLVFPAIGLATPRMTDVSYSRRRRRSRPGRSAGRSDTRRLEIGACNCTPRSDCRELRAACLNKEQLGEVGEGTAADTVAFAANW